RRSPRAHRRHAPRDRGAPPGRGCPLRGRRRATDDRRGRGRAGRRLVRRPARRRRSGGRAVVSRLRPATVLLGALVLGACGFQAQPTTRARLRVIAEPEDARVFVDDRFVATARVLAREPLALRPGTHLVTLTASGYFPHDMQLELPMGETKLEIELRPVPP